MITSRFRERALVTAKSGEVFAGILYSADNTALVLRDAAAVGAGEHQSDLPLDGEIIVLFANVAYIQRI